MLRWGKWFEEHQILSAERFILSVANHHDQNGDPRFEILNALPSVSEFYDAVFDEDGELKRDADKKARNLLLPYFQRLDRLLSGSFPFGAYAAAVFERAGAIPFSVDEEDTQAYRLEIENSRTHELETIEVRVTEVMGNLGRGSATFPLLIDWNSFGTYYPLHWRVRQGGNRVLGGTFLIPPTLVEKMQKDVGPLLKTLGG